MRQHLLEGPNKVGNIDPPKEGEETTSFGETLYHETKSKKNFFFFLPPDLFLFYFFSSYDIFLPHHVFSKTNRVHHFTRSRGQLSHFL